MPSTDFAEFLQILKTRREHFRSLLNLSTQQQELIDRDDYSQLLTILGKKQGLLDRLDEIHSRHPHFNSEWNNRKNSLESNLRKECDTVLVETETILSELLEAENESAIFLTLRRDETKQQLEALSRGTQTHEAYRDSLAPVTTRHLDINQ